MSAKKTILILMILSLGILTGCITKKAPPIELPSADTVSDIKIRTISGSNVTITEHNQIDWVMTVLTHAVPTWKQSNNDQPVDKEYGSITINSNSTPTTIYYYEEGSECYVEQPYQGVYGLKDNIETIISQ